MQPAKKKTAPCNKHSLAVVREGKKQPCSQRRKKQRHETHSLAVEKRKRVREVELEAGTLNMV
jgi:hypothetical protein